MSDAGFYMTATEDEPDKVTCYACGVDKSSWKTTTADPWLEHQKLSPDCKYLELKKKPKMELTVNDFLTIERYRVQRINVRNVPFLFVGNVYIGFIKRIFRFLYDTYRPSYMQVERIRLS